ncbi:MAG: ComEC family competence protein [Alphaproteobacteria bacterium]|nr:ComEC family competence protein [Alphaproteobacteria bacterium]
MPGSGLRRCSTMVLRAEPTVPTDWPGIDHDAPRSDAWSGRIGDVVLAWLMAERDRWVLWLPVLLALGVVLYFHLPIEPPIWPALAAAFGLGVVALLLFRRYGVVALALIACGTIALGFGVAGLRTQAVSAPILDAPLGPVMVSGEVVEAGTGERERRVVLEDLLIDGLAPAATPERVRLTLRGKAAEGDMVVPGARLSVRAHLQPPPEPTAPDAWDFARQAYFERIGGIGYAIAVPVLIAPPEGGGFWARVERVRHAVSRRFNAGLEGEVGPFGAALLIGDRSAMSEDLMGAMRDSGLAHLITISGLNLGLVAGFVFVVLRAGLALVPALALRYPIKKWAAFGALVATFGYFLLSGGGVPTERAFLMTALVLVAVMLDRTSLSMRLLMWAAFVVIFCFPEAVLGPSFQMSFGATIALIAAYEAVRGPLAKLAARTPFWQRPAFYLAAVGFTSLVAGIATGPFALYHFNRFADYGLVANLIAVPLTGLWVMPWGLIALLLMPFGAEWPALAPMSLGLEGIAATARLVASWPGAVSLVPAMPGLALVLIVFGGLWLCLWRRRARLLGVLPMIAALVVIALARPPDLLIDGAAKLFAARAPDGGLWLSSERQGRFLGEAWLRQAGQSEAGPWLIARDDQPCDGEACAFSIAGRSVSVVSGRGALAEECRRADVLIALIPLHAACRGPAIKIDRFDLWREGTHALWLDDDEIRVRTVREARGERRTALGAATSFSAATRRRARW